MIPQWTSHEVKFEAAGQEGTLDDVVIGALLRETERESNGFRTKFILQLFNFSLSRVASPETHLSACGTGGG